MNNIFIPDNPSAPSFPRRRESSEINTRRSGQDPNVDPLCGNFLINWIPACAGMTSFCSNVLSGFILFLCLMPVFAFAGEAKDIAEDPVVEKRMVALAENLRCLVCQNESLASSHAELAEDLRKEVREMIKKGMDDKQITEFLVTRYGDFVLYKPPVKSYTVLLWFGPFALFLIGGAGLFYQLRKRRLSAPEAELTPEAEQRAAALLNEDKDKQE